MVQSVINFKAITVSLFSAIVFCLFFFQNPLTVDEEQIQIIQNIYSEAKEENILLNRHTIKYEPWMDQLWDEENLTAAGIGLCSFNDSNFRQAYNSLQFSLKSLEKKQILQKTIGDKIRVVKKEKNVRFISEAIFIDNYAFSFVRIAGEKSVHIQMKKENGKWAYKCGMPLEFTLN
ncbi:hypothetical protein [Algoriphagus sediminis]|uniref:Uncharacterized protein n=1 Tax=Algoriphagus sediminis TaxID=3057113 RepID=A0ABT7YC71_9BACT|nr:hypothetical protein [Algoriphagus sediminis]MDN3204123.1 hypothetical protein [Algoriphagus sediminis]